MVANVFAIDVHGAYPWIKLVTKPLSLWNFQDDVTSVVLPEFFHYSLCVISRGPTEEVPSTKKKKEPREGRERGRGRGRGRGEVIQSHSVFELGPAERPGAKPGKVFQGSFWVWAQPMRESVAM